MPPRTEALCSFCIIVVVQVIPLLMFSGYLIPYKNIPSYFRFLYWCRYGGSPTHSYSFIVCGGLPNHSYMPVSRIIPCRSFHT